ncbi:MAG: hypothetical protein FWF12_09790 [Betaproteobacteria bacterium]|nr:hypothetical protein [Betaproteobacteria bacterium]
MNSKDDMTKVINQGVTLPAQDYHGLADVVEKAKPSLPPLENGFMPLTKFDPQKPYEDWQTFIEKRIALNERDKLTPDSYAIELKNTHDDNQNRREEHFRQRTEDFEKYNNARVLDLEKHNHVRILGLEKYHTDILALKEEKINDLERKNAELKTKNDYFEQRHLDDVRDHLDKQREYHDRILILTQDVANAKLEWLEIERTHLDTEREKLSKAQDALANEKQNWLTSMMMSIKESKIAKLFK